MWVLRHRLRGRAFRAFWSMRQRRASGIGRRPLLLIRSSWWEVLQYCGILREGLKLGSMLAKADCCTLCFSPILLGFASFPLLGSPRRQHIFILGEPSFSYLGLPSFRDYYEVMVGEYWARVKTRFLYLNLYGRTEALAAVVYPSVRSLCLAPLRLQEQCCRYNMFVCRESILLHDRQF